MDDREVMVSICCMTYNQEKYIGQCLDSFLMQKCNFKFEILINDDASTDKTAEIIRGYESKYPDVVKPIYQMENQFSKGVRISTEILLPKANGKYIALCEGDDYWVDPYKLQKQVDALEKNDSCHMCVHMVDVVSEDGSATDMSLPPKSCNLREGVLSGRELLEVECMERNAFQLSSYFFRSDDIKKYINEKPKFSTMSPVGDLSYLFYFSNLGDVYYYSVTMSHYRRGSDSSVQRVRSTINTKEKLLERYNKQIDAINEFDAYSNGKYHDLCEDKCNALMFFIAQRYHDYREMSKPRYKKIVKRLGIKARIKIYMEAYFPRIMKLYNKAR